MLSTNAFWTVWLLCHLLLAASLLGALTHQAVAAALPARRPAAAPGFVTRFRSVTGPAYATVICVLWVLTMIMGAIMYGRYRIYVRLPIEQMRYWKTVAFFDFKEHVAVLGLGLLPAYWYLWKNWQDAQYDTARKITTVLLAIMCWFVFIVGHVLNNTRGFA